MKPTNNIIKLIVIVSTVAINLPILSPGMSLRAINIYNTTRLQSNVSNYGSIHILCYKYLSVLYSNIHSKPPSLE